MNAQELKKANKLQADINKYERLQFEITGYSANPILIPRYSNGKRSEEVELPREVCWAMNRYIGHQIYALKRELEEL
ncbi:hypothetical protein ACEN4K_03720 [Marinilactibacillus psychrotolerans]|uniref:hypothetical protein n=1 Tax=Marinilactibacillus psychrotolerans TaxID=191770 RepID=UPI003883E223